MSSRSGARAASVRVCFVCLGNICRSPTAEGIFRALVTDAGLSDRIQAESAGTADYHVGELPDPRSRREAASRGVRLESRARQFAPDDFRTFDLVVAMDRANARALRGLARRPEEREKVVLLRSFDPSAARAEELDVPDPYYGGGDGFHRVFDICEAACRGLLDALRAGSAR
jgi:protein-tyrosine phosphatase